MTTAKRRYARRATGEDVLPFINHIVEPQRDPANGEPRYDVDTPLVLADFLEENGMPSTARMIRLAHPNSAGNPTRPFQGRMDADNYQVRPGEWQVRSYDTHRDSSISVPDLDGEKYVEIHHMPADNVAGQDRTIGWGLRMPNEAAHAMVDDLLNEGYKPHSSIQLSHPDLYERYESGEYGPVSQRRAGMQKSHPDLPRDDNRQLPSYAWPGGYPMYYLDNDHSELCPDCANEHEEGGEGISAGGTHMEGPPIQCENCGKDIESAYGDPDEEEHSQMSRRGGKRRYAFDPAVNSSMLLHVAKTMTDPDRNFEPLASRLLDNGYDPDHPDFGLQQILSGNHGRLPRWLSEEDVPNIESGDLDARPHGMPYEDESGASDWHPHLVLADWLEEEGRHPAIASVIRHAHAQSGTDTGRRGTGIWDFSSGHPDQWGFDVEPMYGQHQHKWVAIHAPHPDNPYQRIFWHASFPKEQARDLSESLRIEGAVEHDNERDVWVPQKTHMSRSSSPRRYAAPNGDVQSLPSAMAGASSANQGSINSVAQDIMTELRMLPATGTDAVHTSPQGSRPSMVVRMRSPEQQKSLYAASWLGLMTRQPGMVVFTPGDGDDLLHTLHTQMSGHQLSSALASVGIRDATFIPKKTGMRALVFDREANSGAALRAVASRFKMGLTSKQGSGSFVGAEDQSDARAAYRRVIRGYEQKLEESQPKQPPQQQQTPQQPQQMRRRYARKRVSKADVDKMFADSYGLKRSEAPQIPDDRKEKFLMGMVRHGVGHKDEVVHPSTLKPSQSEWSPEALKKVKSQVEAGGEERNKIINNRVTVSNDGYVLDGHHRYIDAMLRGRKLSVVKVDLPIEHLITAARKFGESEGIERKTA